jgi:hypothetical protein
MSTWAFLAVSAGFPDDGNIRPLHGVLRNDARASTNEGAAFVAYHGGEIHVTVEGLRFRYQYHTAEYIQKENAAARWGPCRAWS